MKPIKIRVEPDILTRFHKQAREAFPKETITYLLGTRKGDRIAIMDIWTPPDVDEYSTEHGIDGPDRWESEGYEYAEEEGWDIVGDLHSHPYGYEFLRKRNKHTIEDLNWPSCHDWEGVCGHTWITGICLVKEDRIGRLRTNTMFFGPLLALEEL